MLQTAARSKKSTPKKAAPHERFLEAFRWMLLARTLEEKLVSLYRGGQITGGVYIGKGQEAVSVACGLFLQKGDIFAPLIRDQAGRSAFGEPLIDVTRTYLGSRLGPMRGRDGNIHRGNPRDGQLAMISHLGAMVSMTVGALMAKRFRGEKGFIGLTCIGEGGMQTGSFHEGMNLAAVEQVPLVVVATNNHYAYSTPNEREFACEQLLDRAKGYGFEGYNLDGTDLSQCLDIIGSAVKRARAGRPPQLVVAEILRLSGHGEHDDASYVTDEIKRQPFAQDCLKLAEKKVLDYDLLDPATLQSWREDAVGQVDEAIATAQKEPSPEGAEEDWCAISTRELADHAEPA
ncbi:MAG TPA: thiamine pyrophosphate-dependent dehydrogenase E1 component subunit alpha [Chthoniobacterales bacterium]|jgi:pyruvate dehydrogenase E1 component alpha subunit/2-oxoisovalerate dehydrogenase E1 component alpha subunit|nr:thiamine pyrophosphate-dependent dehydrogenase E1 component subunit alpha [Chthoniobacterales bacterium]